MAEQRQAAEILGENLRRYRNDRGWSQEEAAEKADLSRAAYIQIEMGKAEPRTGTLLRLAETFGLKLEELFVPARRLTFVRFRAHARLNTRNETLSNVSRWLDDYLLLEKALDQQPMPQLRRSVRLKSGNWKEQVQSIAAMVRTDLGLMPLEGIRDICGLLEDRAGIKLLATQVRAEGFFGLSVGKEDGGPAIVVNTEERIPIERQVFTAVHELGHVIMHPDAYDASAVEEIAQEENEANYFAGCFLMPDELFRNEWGETSGHAFVDRVLKVKRIFHVSYKTVLYQISETIDGEHDVWNHFLDEYQKKYGRTLEKTEEPDAIRGSLLDYGAPARLEPMRLERADFIADRFRRLVREALEKEEISRSTAAGMLGITVSELRELQASWSVA